MENNCSKPFHAKIQAILTLFCLCFFIHQHASAVADNFPFQGESIRLACGSPADFQSPDGRSWTGDSNSPYFHSFEPDNNSSRVSYVTNQARSPERYYLQARLSYSRFTYIFKVSAGQKFIRLYFYPTSYPGFDRSESFFSVTIHSFTLLKNVSASLADAYGDDTYFKEFCFNVDEDQRLNITLAPSVEGAYAFINGIEIVSMPTNLYYTAAGSRGPKFLGQENQLYTIIGNSNALETVYRINIGGNSISTQYDTAGMYRTWTDHYLEYLTAANPGVVPVPYNRSISGLNFSKINDYTAPAAVYQTAMSMGKDGKINQNSNLTWEFPVDSGFTFWIIWAYMCK